MVEYWNGQIPLAIRILIVSWCIDSVALSVIDFIMTKAMDDASFGIEWGQKRLADLDFADDISAISHTLAGIQEITNNIETFGAKIGLRINCEKTKAMKIGPEQHPPSLIMQQNVDYVEKFPYLGSYMSSDGDSEPDVRARIGKAASIFQRLRPIWSSTTINLNVKLRLYTNIVIPRQFMRVRRGREQP